ncbi:MAG: FtsW/RodA/SpoVE family cell cycle protein [Armatimonadetes bacterium]|nr:FtsW/RodA/SpoVE family cell cycle protein [Armatimonadota bacterium]MDE2205218.1 FtsW/RodA/SpoVE family cell cycle protein [Armatimonadota bacterium]
MTTLVPESPVELRTNSTEMQSPPFDYYLFAATFVLAAGGIAMVFDTTYPQVGSGALLAQSQAYFAVKQAIGVVAGFGAMAFFARLPIARLMQFVRPAALIAWVALLFVFVPHIGHTVNDAARWVGPAGAEFQPAECAKLIMLLFVVSEVCNPEPKRGRWVYAYIGIPVLANELLICLLKRQVNAFGVVLMVASVGLLVLARMVQQPIRPGTKQAVPTLPRIAIALTAVVICLRLIEQEPDLGTAAVLLAAVYCVLVAARVAWRTLAMVALVTVIAFASATVGYTHRRSRIETWLHPSANASGDGYQVWQSVRAVGSGYIFGRGVGLGLGKYFIPQADTDFAFATIGEELGLCGSVALLALFGLVIFRGMIIAERAGNLRSQLLAVGITSLIGWQAIINIGVATDTIPNTGVPMPFLSFGLTTLITTMAGIGILLRIGLESPRSKLAVGAPVKP